MTTAVKYCGGCNPQYDRVAAVKQLLNEITPLGIGSAGLSEADVVLLVCGCPSRCVSQTPLTGKQEKLLLCSPADFESAKERIAASANPATDWK